MYTRAEVSKLKSCFSANPSTVICWRYVYLELLRSIGDVYILSFCFQYFSGHFDTEVGPKQEASSYKNILAKIEAEPSNVLFLTDIVKGTSYD